MSTYTYETVVRALDAHQAAGLIKHWYGPPRKPHAEGGWQPSFPIRVDLVRGEQGFQIKTLREAYVFVAGLASAHFAVDERPSLDQPVAR